MKDKRKHSKLKILVCAILGIVLILLSCQNFFRSTESSVIRSKEFQHNNAGNLSSVSVGSYVDYEDPTGEGHNWRVLKKENNIVYLIASSSEDSDTGVNGDNYSSIDDIKNQLKRYLKKYENEKYVITNSAQFPKGDDIGKFSQTDDMRKLKESYWIDGHTSDYYSSGSLTDFYEGLYSLTWRRSSYKTSCCFKIRNPI